MDGPFPKESFLGGLAPPELRLIEVSGSRRDWEAGTFLFREGQTSDAVFFLLDGVVKVVKTAPTGHESLVELRRRGDVVGELGAIDGQVRAASVASVTRIAAIAVAAPRFEQLLATNPKIAHRLLLTVVARLRVASERQLEMGTVDVVGRVCRRIAELAVEATTDPGEVAVVRNVSQQDLANWAGVSRDGVVRALHELRRRGWVRTGRQRIEIIDLFELSRRANG